MLIKTTKDKEDHHFFLGFSDVDDKQIDHDVTTIFYKIWAINTSNDMFNMPFSKKLMAK